MKLYIPRSLYRTVTPYALPQALQNSFTSHVVYIELEQTIFAMFDALFTSHVVYIERSNIRSWRKEAGFFTSHVVYIERARLEINQEMLDLYIPRSLYRTKSTIR